MTLRRTILALPLLFAACPAWAQQPCEGLTSVSIPGVKITSATSVSAGALTLPAGSLPATLQVPAFCRVAATVGKEVRIELWMPRQWNHKLLAVGNGGMAGSISYLPMVKPSEPGLCHQQYRHGAPGQFHRRRMGAGKLRTHREFCRPRHSPDGRSRQGDSQGLLQRATGPLLFQWMFQGGHEAHD